MKRAMISGAALFAVWAASATACQAQVVVGAPFVGVYAGNGGVAVRAPFVNLYVPPAGPVVYGPRVIYLPPPVVVQQAPATVVTPAPQQPQSFPPAPAQLVPTIPPETKSVPLPPPITTAPPPSAAPATQVQTLEQFSRSFQARAGTFDATLINPVTLQPTAVRFALPEGTPRRVVVTRDSIEWHYRIGQWVRIEFDRKGATVVSRDK